MKKWTQSDLRFCKNEESKRSKNNKIGGQQDGKSRRKLVENMLQNNTFGKMIPTLGQIISGTKCDTNVETNHFFCRKRGQ